MFFKVLHIPVLNTHKITWAAKCDLQQSIAAEHVLTREAAKCSGRNDKEFFRGSGLNHSITWLGFSREKKKNNLIVLCPEGTGELQPHVMMFFLLATSSEVFLSLWLQQHIFRFGNGCILATLKSTFLAWLQMSEQTIDRVISIWFIHCLIP